MSHRRIPLPTQPAAALHHLTQWLQKQIPEGTLIAATNTYIIPTPAHLTTTTPPEHLPLKLAYDLSTQIAHALTEHHITLPYITPDDIIQIAAPDRFIIIPKPPNAFLPIRAHHITIQTPPPTTTNAPQYIAPEITAIPTIISPPASAAFYSIGRIIAAAAAPQSQPLPQPSLADFITHATAPNPAHRRLIYKSQQKTTKNQTN